jgi:hypothetical protein
MSAVGKGSRQRDGAWADVVPLPTANVAVDKALPMA